MARPPSLLSFPTLILEMRLARTTKTPFEDSPIIINNDCDPFAGTEHCPPLPPCPATFNRIRLPRYQVRQYHIIKAARLNLAHMTGQTTIVIRSYMRQSSTRSSIFSTTTTTTTTTTRSPFNSRRRSYPPSNQLFLTTFISSRPSTISHLSRSRSRITHHLSVFAIPSPQPSSSKWLRRRPFE
jgi:hypothetical protein